MSGTLLAERAPSSGYGRNVAGTQEALDQSVVAGFMDGDQAR